MLVSLVPSGGQGGLRLAIRLPNAKPFFDSFFTKCHNGILAMSIFY